jgi:4a-hydroxytetrahydrobiopterin dehydratase
MPRPKLASDEEIQLSMRDIPFWRLDGNSIIREIAVPNFVAAIGIVNAIAILAERANHHPDILIYGWNKLRITLSTHDIGGLSSLDFELAKKIDELNI